MHFFAYLARLKFIQRWHLMRPAIPENVQQHGFEVAVIAHALAVVGNHYFERKYEPAEVALAAIFHDAGEVLTGDLPSPIKYASPELASAYKALETEARERLLKMLPDELQPEYRRVLEPTDKDTRRLVKAADKLSAYLKAAQEVRLGNEEFRAAEVALKAQVENDELPESKYFRDHFGPSFLKSLDELSQKPLE
jgi:5'-deoxynucleotidase